MRAWLAAFILTASLFLDAGSVLAWSFIQAGSAGSSDWAVRVLIDSLGDVISGGFLRNAAHEIVLIKHSGADGSEMWRLTLPGSTSNGGGGIHLFEDPHGDILASINRQLPTGALSSVLLKLSPDGSELWRLDVPDVHLYAADSDGAGNLVAAGQSLEASPYGDLFIIAVDNSGNELWRRTISGALDAHIDGGETATALRFDANGDVIMAGAMAENPAINYPDFVVFKLARADGAELWRAIVPSNAGHGGNAYAVAVDAAGDVVAVGSAVLVDWCDAVVVKLNGENGSEAWRTVIDEPETGSCDYLSAVALNDDGDVFATGAPRTIYYSVFKLSGATGASLWRHDIPNLASPTGGECCGGKSVSVRPDGSVVAMGIRLGPTGPGQIAVTRLDPTDGHELFLRILDTDGCGDGYPAMTLGPDGDIALAAAVFHRVGGECIWPHGYDYGVFKLTGASGLDFWGGCQDERDNDGDALVDLADPQCSGPYDATENPQGGGFPCGIGPELAALLPALWRLRRLRRSRPQAPGTSERSTSP
jgi:outer membrane protein assembly factor BamB